MGKAKDELIEAFDREEGRVRLYHDELEAIIGVCSALKVLEAEIPHLKRISMYIDRKVWKKFDAARGLLRGAVAQYTTKMALKQYRQLRNNEGNVSFTAARNPGNFNLPEEAYYTLVTAARLGACSKCDLLMNRNEWSKCYLCELFDSVPCREGKFEKGNAMMGICPYALNHEGEFHLD